MKNLLVLDMAFNYRAIQERQLFEQINSRRLGGFFTTVWTVHPLGSLLYSNTDMEKYGRPAIYSLDEGSRFIEGKIGVSSLLNFLPPINLLLGQLVLFVFLIKLVENHRIKIIRVGDPLYLGIFGYLLCKVTGSKLLVRVAANNEKCFEATGSAMMPRLFRYRTLERFVERFVLARADLIAAANEDNQRFALSCGADVSRTTLFRYGNLIDKRHFQDPSLRPFPREQLEEFNLSSKTFLLYVGRFEPVKHPDDVLRTLARLHSEGQCVGALLVGDGSMKNDLVRLAEKLSVDKFVFFAGNRSQSWLAAVIPHSLIAVSPHTGRALVEVALGQVPVVAYDIDWQSELIRADQTGLLVPYRDSSGLAAAALKFLIDPALSRFCAANLRKHALELMDPERLNQHERDMYQRLFNE